MRAAVHALLPKWWLERLLLLLLPWLWLLLWLCPVEVVVGVEVGVVLWWWV